MKLGILCYSFVYRDQIFCLIAGAGNSQATFDYDIMSLAHRDAVIFGSGPKVSMEQL